MSTVSVANTDANLSGKTLMATANAETVTGLKTFDRDPSAPFAVTSGSAVVTNLDADKLDGLEAADLSPLTNFTWTSPAFNAADFTANGGMTWTVGSGDVVTYAYIINGKTMVVAFTLTTTTVSGGQSDLQIKIPASKTAAKTMVGTFFYNDNNAANGIGLAQVSASGTNIILEKPDLIGGVTNWNAATNTTAVSGHIIFEIS